MIAKLNNGDTIYQVQVVRETDEGVEEVVHEAIYSTARAARNVGSAYVNNYSYGRKMTYRVRKTRVFGIEWYRIAKTRREAVKNATRNVD